MANPERIDLDQRGLMHCPILLDEEKLRLLNYQDNEISEIQNLNTVPNLVFLDLYSNQLRRISGLNHVPALRVLMLGKNQISRIQNLTGLPKLDVLDLHCNLLTKVTQKGEVQTPRW